MKFGRDILIGALVLINALLLRYIDPLPIQYLRNLAFDTYQRISPRPYDPNVPVRIGAIDEEALAKYGQWPWSRATMAEIVDRLTELGAASIAIDVLYSEPDRTSPKALIASLPQDAAYSGAREELALLPDPDERFAETLARTPTVLAFAYDDRAKPDSARSLAEKFAIIFLGDQELAHAAFLRKADGAVLPLKIFMEAAPGLGEIHAGDSDFDGIIRRVPLAVSILKTAYPSLAAEALRIAIGGQTGGQTNTTQIKTFDYTPTWAVHSFSDFMRQLSIQFNQGGVDKMRIGEAIIPVNASAELTFYDTGYQSKRYFSLAEVLEPDFDASKVSDRIILIGATVEGLKDIRSGPVSGYLPGVEVHAQILEQILGGIYLDRPFWAGFGEGLYLAIFGIVLLVLMLRRAALLGLVISLGALLISVGGSWWAFRVHGFLFDPIYPGLAVLLIFLTGTMLNYLRTESEKAFVRSAFSRYLSPELVDQVSQHPDRLKLGGELRELTLMFADIRGFTKISEGLDPKDLTHLINSYLTPMTRIVQQHEGTIDKYIGDCIMAFWNAPLEIESHNRKAILAAFAMREGLARLNESLRAEAQKTGKTAIELRAGIGINAGLCCVGNMGSEQRFNYSALGDAVNIASRLEALSQNYGVDLVIGQEAAAAAADLALLELDFVRVKGKDRPIRIYTGLGDATVAQSQAFTDLKSRQEMFLTLYRRKGWDAAEAALAECRAIAPGQLSGYYDLFQRRIAKFRRDPPPMDWDGVYVAITKTG